MSLALDNKPWVNGSQRHWLYNDTFQDQARPIPRETPSIPMASSTYMDTCGEDEDREMMKGGG
jgi:hypothetical protein